jgi:hypothetical protein
MNRVYQRGQFGAEKGGQIAPESGGQFRAENPNKLVFFLNVYSKSIKNKIMNHLSPSPELANIFIKNGFEEFTQKHYPQHWVRLQEKDCKPGTTKRYFKIPGHRDVAVLFDYINLEMEYKKSLISYKLSSNNELKAFIAFLKLGPTDRKALSSLADQEVRVGGDRTMNGLVSMINEFKEEPRMFYNRKACERFIKTFDEVILN